MTENFGLRPVKSTGREYAGLPIKVSLPKERFWVTIIRELSPGMYLVRCDNDLTAYPYKVGDELEVSVEHFRNGDLT